MKTRTTLRIVTITLVAFVMTVLSSDASAKQHKQIVNGKEVVVHSNPIPVILHRMVPPQYGRHVTQKEVSHGKKSQPIATPTAKNRP